MTTFNNLKNQIATVVIEETITQDNYAILKIELIYKNEGVVSFNAAAEYDSEREEWFVDLNDRGNEYYDWCGQVIATTEEQSNDWQECLAELVEGHRAVWKSAAKESLA
ncbi:hypothetical protein AU074_13680 [Pseudomonas sp. ATCC PTA-122608]|uniref:hypothetical protein n=1 Tax=Pseudomonas sp. ATCC PTA-122608 TaxID=1771311 RepID=UPI00096BA50A|nr:hypothetical protein [Pseudomonas sp. ATCC PTA-122608]OLY72220.1 hypothetical protein AU074_13680 [Pseudomonas sp. ATCC PTA-122608]